MQNNSWDETTKRPAEQTKQALEQAISEVKTPEQADQVIADLERKGQARTEVGVANSMPMPNSAEDAADAIQETANGAQGHPEDVIAQIAAQIAAADPADKDVLSEGVQRAAQPEAKDIKQPATEEERKLLQEALLRQLKPLQKADTAAFLAINSLPHPRVANDLMYLLTTVMNRGDGWVAGLVLATLFNHRRRRALLDVLPALWLMTATVEFPIKHFFRRKRPFISLLRAVVVGRKPGNFSFPSGHSAAAFGGAWLLTRHFPKLAPLFYAIAALVGFSRVYLGAHYPGDVLSGAVLGTVLSEGYRAVIEDIADAID